MDVLKQHLCSDCGNSFRTAWDLKKHINTVHLKSAPEMCPICGDSFAFKYKLKNHMVSKHAFKKDFECDTCGGTFLSKPGLIIHTRTCNVMKHACTECTKVFKKKSRLKRHLEGHLGEKSYNCDKCAKSFNYGSSLSEHKKNKHNNVLPFVCEVCLKSFSRKSGLKVHQTCHTGELPFQCNLCLKQYREKRPLVNHLKKTHNEEFTDPDIKAQKMKTVNSSETEMLISAYFEISTKNQWKEQKVSKYEVKSSNENCNEDENTVLKSPTKQEQNMCLSCFYTTSYIAKYHYHVYFKHGEGQHRAFFTNSENKYECDQCEFTSPKLMKLKQHIATNHASSDHINISIESKEGSEDIKIEDFSFAMKKLNYSESAVNKKEQNMKSVKHGFIRSDEESTTEIESMQENVVNRNIDEANEQILSDTTNNSVGQNNHLKGDDEWQWQDYNDTIEGEYKETIEGDILLDKEDEESIKIKLEELMDIGIYSNNTAIPSQIESAQMFQISESGEYTCGSPGCEYKSKNKSIIKKHIMCKHFNLRNSPCEECSYIAKSPGALKMHVAGVHRNECHICPECGFKTKWLTSLNGHIKTVHLGIKKRTGGKIQTCADCDYTCDRKETMTKHIKGRHVKESIQCEKCRFKTYWQLGLERHMKTVHGDYINKI